MPTHRVTMLDVANRAGVSRTTASFVLAGRRDMRISVDAKQRVLRAARELDYRPNVMARGLRTRLTDTIGLISDTLATEPFAGHVISGVLATALRHQHLLFIGETNGDRTVEERLVHDMIDRGVDGFLYAAMFTQQVRPPAALKGHPLVLVNCVNSGATTSAVVPDERLAGRAAVEALLVVGHTDGIYLAGTPAANVFAARERLAGIEEALDERALRLGGRIACDWWPEPAYVAVAKALSGAARPTALVCLNDRIAFGAYQALQEAGLRVPDDVSVVSFDDSELAAWMRPAVTSVALPHVELGRRAVELLLDRELKPGVERIPMPLHERESIGPPRA